MSTPALEVHDLVYRYGSKEALHGLNLTVQPGECHGLFGRNGAGKTTAIKCLLHLLRPDSGSIRVMGLDPARAEARVKSSLAYVPDFVAFYPWMSVREALDYQASFRQHWNGDLEASLLRQFRLDPTAPTSSLSKGQRTQLALVGAIAAEPELLVLDEPTSGLDPRVRREFIQTVIGAYQDSAPGKRTVLVSTHLIHEFEGLIDRFTIVDQGRSILTSDADAARARFRRVRAEYSSEPPADLICPNARQVRRDARALEWVVEQGEEELLELLQPSRPHQVTVDSLSLEEIFLNTVK